MEANRQGKSKQEILDTIYQDAKPNVQKHGIGSGNHVYNATELVTVEQLQGAEGEAMSETVTYVPGPEDNPVTKWMGYVFQANTPKTITNPKLIEMARGNRFFKVGPFNHARDAVPTVEQVPGPKNSDQYRAHAVAWLKKMESVDQLDRKWASEETLRMDCEVGTDDLDLLRSLFEPKRAELRKQEMPG